MNESGLITNVLSRLVDQRLTNASVRIVVADGGSSDGTVEQVRRMAMHHPQIELLHNPKRFAGPARNLAVKSGPFDVFVVVDAHCHVPDPFYLERIVVGLHESRAFCLSRPQPINPNVEGAMGRASAIARASWLGHCPGSLVYDMRTRGFVTARSAAQVYRSEVFDEVGLFREDLEACEDLEFNVRVDRVGLSAYHCPEACLEYHPRQSLRKLFHHMFRYGRGRAQVMAIHPSVSAILSGFLPALMALWIVLGGLVFRAGSRLGTVYVGSLTLYLLLIQLESLRLARKYDFRLAGILPLHFAAIHLGWGAGQLFAMMSGACLRRDDLASSEGRDGREPASSSTAGFVD